MTESSNLAEQMTTETIEHQVEVPKQQSAKLKSVKPAVTKSVDEVLPEKQESSIDKPAEPVIKVSPKNEKVPAKTKGEVPAKKQAKPTTKSPARKRPSRREVIERQANPKSKFAGQQKTMLLDFDYRSDILHEYLQMNQSTMLSAYERLAALLRMVANESTSFSHVSEWITQNVKICSEQIKELQAQREAIIADTGSEDVSLHVNVPDSYKTTFEPSHPIAHKMLAILRLVDNELNESEMLYLAGILDDSSYIKLRNQSTTIIRGSVDRIYKATSPGVRNGGRYSPQTLAQWIREGNKLMFADLPLQHEHLVKDAQ